MRARFRQTLSRVRSLALRPVIERLDALNQVTTVRLDELSKRVSEMEAVLQAVEGRAATVSERSVAQHESQARLARRVDEIEKLLSQG